MRIRAFITHKVSEHFADCQDRFAISEETKAIAVSDGMGATWQQKTWAELLVNHYTENSDGWMPSAESIKPLCKRWRVDVEAAIKRMGQDGTPEYLRYLNERSLKESRSAGATFVGIRFDGNHWKGSVLGDSCLIEWDGAEGIFHTSQELDGFDNYPDYFDSDEKKLGKGIPKPISGDLGKVKCLLMVSDPFSDFLLAKKREGKLAEYVNNIISVENHDYFETMVADWRGEGMHNDDSTLIVIEPDDADSFNIVHQDSIAELIAEERKAIATETSAQSPSPIAHVTRSTGTDTEATTLPTKLSPTPDIFTSKLDRESACQPAKENSFLNSRVPLNKDAKNLLDGISEIVDSFKGGSRGKNNGFLNKTINKSGLQLRKKLEQLLGQYNIRKRNEKR